MSARRLPRVPLLVILSAVGPLYAGGCSLDETTPVPSCGDRGSILIVAQSVPSAAFVPCIDDPGSGWEPTRVHVDEDGALMRFDLGPRAVATADVEFLRACAEAGGASVEGDADGVGVSVIGRAGRRYTFEGGCVRIRIDGDAGEDAVDALVDAVVLVERAQLAAEVRRSLVEENL